MRKDGRQPFFLYLKPALGNSVKAEAKRRKITAYQLVEEILEIHLASLTPGEVELPPAPKAATEEDVDDLLQTMTRDQVPMGSPGRPRYKADIAGGSLQVSEARVIADLLLNEAGEAEWRRAIEVDNVLQKRSVGTARRQATLVRARLSEMGPELWAIVRDGSKPAATHAMLACAIKHSPLLSDFLHYTVRESYRMFHGTLPRRAWDKFIERCHDLDPFMPEWAQSTVDKLGDSAFRVLHEAGFLADGAKNVLKPVRIDPSVATYLRDHGEDEVLRRMQVTQ
jgi:hypothetical protein